MNSIARCSCVGAFFFIWTVNALSLSTDRQLLALIPPESAVVARVEARPGGGRPIGNALIISKISWEDLGQFFAWTGGDASREIQQMLIASQDFTLGNVVHHSLLAKGHFDRIRIYNSLLRNGGGPRAYRGVEVATVPQVQSRANRADETALWLAVLDDQILLLGNQGTIQEELDRYLAGMLPAPTLLQRVAQLDPDDVAWSMVAISERRAKELGNLLSSLDPTLPQILSNGETFVFSVHFNKQIRLEFRVFVNPSGGADDVSESLLETSPQLLHRSSLTSRSSDRQIVTSNVLFSRRASMRWLAERDRSGLQH